ncbi:MAG: LicD family protein [Lachnospiraceae bacterium]|nr:LicD family protein [Lachnospiraceae bacterium]
MEIPESFFDSEVRDGFYIPSFMKRSWAATLQVLDEMSKVCLRHDIKWWIDWGSLLATVRHRGFIPWDDDLDVSMMREDYMKFNRYAMDELPEGYFVNNIYNNPAFDEYHTRLLNSKDIDRSERFLNRNHGFPYLAGVDIFCIDYVNPDKREDERISSLIYSIGSIATNLPSDIYLKDIPQFKGVINDIEAISGFSVNDDEPVRQQINKICDTLMQSTKEEDATHVTCMVLHTGRENYSGLFPKEYYEKFIYLPYEFLMVPAPLHYDKILRTIFGDYMKPYRGGGVHEYPYYKAQENKLNESGHGLLRQKYSYEI